MKRLFLRIRNFFFPPVGASTWVRVLPYSVLGVMTLVVLTTGAYTWDYTNSPSFCGNTCHTMPPEYTAYLTSPHARIDCVDCHIGKGFIATRITRKAGDLKHVFATALNNYEFPIRAHELRPARETCERCHSPEKFSDDSLRAIQHYGNDSANTKQTTFLVLKTGGGNKRLGMGRGIHWHIVNKVSFLPLDEEQQQIPYVRVVEDDGTITEYMDINSDIKPDQIKPENLVEMDCITCHNRITHLSPPPENSIDQLITQGLISKDIPYIRREALNIFNQKFDTVQMGLNAIGGLPGYYQNNYPEFFAKNSSTIDQAVVNLQDAYRNSFFPEQKSDWTSHPNNVGHKDSPGCFRCHDGKHLSNKQEAIRLECNLCHSIPVVGNQNDSVTDLEISQGNEPQTHKNPNWISLHRDAFNKTCENCHTTGNPGGVNNSSFCSNTACHGNVWKYAGFNAPKLREILLAQIPPTPTLPPPVETPTLATPAETATPETLLTKNPETSSTAISKTNTVKLTYADTIGPLFQSRCGGCHGPEGTMGLNLTNFAGAMAGGSNGAVILPGNPQGSILVQKQSGSQPHYGQLTKEELSQVTQWIEFGAPEK